MTFKFADKVHEETFHRFCEKYSVNPHNPDYNLLFYLLSAIVNENHIDDLITYKGHGQVQVKTDALRHGWVTGGSARIIRLAFHLFNYGTPTAYCDDLSPEEQKEEINNYLPMSILGGLDSRLTSVALEALTAFCYWDN